MTTLMDSVAGNKTSCHHCMGKEVDLGLGPFDVTYPRSKVVSFSTYVAADYMGLFLPRPKLEKDLQGFLKPLSWQVWTGMFSCLVFTLLLTLLVRSPSPSRQRGGVRGVFEGSWVIRSLFQQAIVRLPTRDASRLLVGTWLVAALILISAYKGVLTSLLAVPRVDIPINSLADLVNYGRQKWALERGTSVHQAIFIMNDEYSKTGECSYYIAEVPMKIAFLSFGFQKDSPLVETFNNLIFALRESGSLSKSYYDITINATACLVKPGKEGTRSSIVFSLYDLGGVFISLAVDYKCGGKLEVLVERIGDAGVVRVCEGTISMSRTRRILDMIFLQDDFCKVVQTECFDFVLCLMSSDSIGFRDFTGELRSEGVVKGVSNVSSFKGTSSG
ncbi:putative glutamate receptor [Oratosquilla oratoria]|uniref:putative glutamate receptor n=1 Tax=Oratosquilla oratoria TaxID=337810 RepID=UPI003F774B0F